MCASIIVLLALVVLVHAAVIVHRDMRELGLRKTRAAELGGDQLRTPV